VGLGLAGPGLGQGPWGAAGAAGPFPAGLHGVGSPRLGGQGRLLPCFLTQPSSPLPFFPLFWYFSYRELLRFRAIQGTDKSALVACVRSALFSERSLCVSSPVFSFLTHPCIVLFFP